MCVMVTSHTLRRRLRKLYEDFRPDKIYWKLVLLLRKLCLACIAILADGRPQLQVVLRLLVPTNPTVHVSSS